MFPSYIDTSALAISANMKAGQTYTTFIEQQGSNYFLQNEFERKLDESVTRAKLKKRSEYINI